MLSVTVARSQRLAVASTSRARVKSARPLVVKVHSAKKSRESELEEAYKEQLAYLERRRERLLSPRVRQVKRSSGQEESSAAASPTPIAQPAPTKAKAAAEPSIQIAQEVPAKKKAGGNPFGFLGGLFAK